MTTPRDLMNRTKFQEVLDRSDLDAVIASSLENVYYTSGAYIETQRRLRDRPVFSIVPTEGAQAIIVCDIEESLARGQTWIDQDEVYVYIEFAQSPIELLAAVLRSKGLADGKIGLERRHLHVAYYTELQELLPRAGFVGFDAEFDEIRAIKTPEEIKRLAEAAIATEKAYVKAWSESREGDTEAEIARKLMDSVLELGADSIRFLTFGSGENNKHTHNKASKRQVKRGDLVRCDFGAHFGPYTSDVARMAAVVEPMPDQARLYRVIHDIEIAAIDYIKPGVRACDVFNFCAKEFSKHELSLQIPHVGHGQLVGGGHENPILQPYNQQELLPNMALYFELLYIDKEVDTYHVEDLVLVTDHGSRVLSNHMNTNELFII